MRDSDRDVSRQTIARYIQKLIKYDFYNAMERHARKFIGEENIVSNPLLDGNRIMRERISYDVEIDTSGLKEAKELFALIDKYFK